MRIACPFCGERDGEEFAILGSASPKRPDPGAPDALSQFNAHVHLRENPAGAHAEHWYHAAGCRRWLIVTRDTRNHDILSVTMAAP